MTPTHRNGGVYPVLLALVLILIAQPGRVAAQGWIEPRPGPPPTQWGIEKLRTAVTVRVSGRVATVEVEEWFRNNGGGLGEGDYVYPLPGEAVFTGYSLYQGDDELRGELMDAARAREIYESIVRARQDPALIELIGKGMIRARVFPIAAGETRRITLRYTQVVERAGDALQFRYAAGSRHAGVQPFGVRALPRADAAPLTFTLTIDDGARFRDAFSPTHRLDVSRSGGRMTVRPAAELAGDFAVFLPFAVNAVGLALAAHNPAGDDGYFMLTLSPGDAAASRIPRDVTVVVDVSGSMSGEKMEQARGAVNQLLGTLNANDRFRVIAFSSAVRPWRDGWSAATPAELRAARQWVGALRAEGGTNIAGALESALREKSAAERLPIVVFMTDGMATNGERRTDRIIALAEAERGRARIFAFGVGYDVNTHLLDALSDAARGTTQYVAPGESVEGPVSLLAARIRHPVLTDLALGRAPVRLTEVYPRELPDLFSGEELVLFGRYAGSGEGALAVTGRRDGRTERYTATVRFPVRDDANEYIQRLWASRKLGDLDRRIRSAQADGASRSQLAALEDELRQTALRYGLLSEYTAYLVQEPVAVAGARPQLPTDMIASRSVDSGAGVPPAASSPAASFTGQAAVQRAEGARRAREVNSIADIEAVELATAGAAKGTRVEPGQLATRRLGGRVFELRDGIWVDIRYTSDLRDIGVEPYSSAYFDLLRALPELALVLRHADHARVAGERVAITVAPGGATTLSAAELRTIVAGFRAR